MEAITRAQSGSLVYTLLLSEVPGKSKVEIPAHEYSDVETLLKVPEEGKTMLKVKPLSLRTALVIAGFSILPSAFADGQPCFTIASLQGHWSSVATYGANVALAFGPRIIDATGHFTATFVLNAPVVGSTTGERRITTGTNVGFYTVNCDGTGTVTRLLTASNGVTTTQIDDFLITTSILKEGHLIATAMVDAVRVPSALVPGGIFVDRKLTRQSNPAEE